MCSQKEAGLFWGIENKQHHNRDVTACGDASRIRRKPGIFALSAQPCL
jgi:predicted transposase YbfD/YdcC